MEFRWRALLLTLLAALLLVAAGCGGNGDDEGAEGTGDTATEQATTAEESTEPVTLTFWQTMNEDETKTLQEIVDRFQDEHPNYTIQMETVPFDQAQQRFATAAQGGKAPDVLRAEIAWIADYAAQGFLADITDKVSEEDRADFLEAPFAYGVWQDRVYAVPQVTDAPALLYNKQMFEEAGVEPPETMEDLVAACEEFGAGKGIFLRGDAYFVQPWIWAYGGGLLDPEQQEILVDDEGSVEGLQAYIDLFNHECAFRNRDFANDYDNMQTAFKNGEVAMIVNGPWATADILSGPAFSDPENLGVAPVPEGPGGQGSPVGGHNYVIGANTENADAAYEFVAWLSSAENQAILAERNNLIPTRNSAYEEPAVEGNPIISQFKAQMEVATNRPVIPEGGQIYADFTPNVQKALTGDTSAQAALQAVAEAWKKFLRDYQ